MTPVLRRRGATLTASRGPSPPSKHVIIPSATAERLRTTTHIPNHHHALLSPPTAQQGAMSSARGPARCHRLTLHYITLHYITLHYAAQCRRHADLRGAIALYYITLHYITLHHTCAVPSPYTHTHTHTHTHTQGRERVGGLVTPRPNHGRHARASAPPHHLHLREPPNALHYITLHYITPHHHTFASRPSVLASECVDLRAERERERESERERWQPVGLARTAHSGWTPSLTPTTTTSFRDNPS